MTDEIRPAPEAGLDRRWLIAGGIGLLALCCLCGLIAAAVYGGFNIPRLTAVVVAPPQTPAPPAPPAPPAAECPSSFVEAGKGLTVNMTAGFYHFNVACAGCSRGVEANYVVSVSGPTTVVVPEGSVWSYGSSCPFGVLQELTTRDSAGDFWPTSLPSWLAQPGVSLLTVY